MSRFIHPIHARGVRSTNFAVRGSKLLTDSRILHYIKSGFYGPDMQAEAVGEVRPKKRKTRPPRSAMSVLRELRQKLGLE